MRFPRTSRVLGLLLLATACNESRAPATGNDVDVGAVASDAEADIANYAATARTVSATPVASPTPAAIAVTANLETPEEVVRRYTDALAARRYDEAWRLWEGEGIASGMTQAAFADSFGKYASFEAVVGTPRDADAGAGQRFITVPVTVTGTLRSGGPFRLEGPVVLHKVADGIESDDPDAHRWRLRSSEMKPRPVTGASPAP